LFWRMNLTKAVVLSLLLVICYAQYTPDWASLDTRPTPEWYLDAKFGIFIHWGVYSVPAYGSEGVYAEWYGWYINQPNSPDQAFHNKTYGPNFKYSEFANSFNAELWDPVAWANLFQRSGAKYVVPTSKHHEGFTLWPSAESWNWNAVDIGPHRDLLGELFAAVRAVGLHPALYYSLYEWYHPLYTGPDPSLYVNQVMLPQLYDLATNYQPDLIWTDGEWEHNSTFWQSPQFLAWLFNESPNKDNVAINDRWGNDTRGVHGGFYTAEYSTQVWLNHSWEENSGMDVFSYGLNRATNSDHYWSASYLINLLTRSVCNGGNLLLDIGPAADGTIPTIMQERLLEIGDWLSVNGEAIYSTRTWRQQQDVIFPNTTSYLLAPNSTTVYGLCSEWVASGCNTTTVKLMGVTKTVQDCQAYCDAEDTCLSYTWYDSTNGNLSMTCFIRIGYDDAWSPMYQSGAYSAQKTHWTIQYTTVPATSAVYAIVHPWPPADFFIPSPKFSSNTTVSLLGYNGPISVKGQEGQPGLTITPPQLSPSQLPCDYSYSFKLVNVE
jgi:alpha-L-fucosidase